MALPVGLQTEIDNPSFVFFVAAELDLPVGTLRLLDGSSAVMVDGSLYTGGDDTYGVLAFPESHTDGVDQTAPRMRVTLSPATDAAAAELIAPNVQGSAVKVRWGAVNEASGLSAGSVQVFLAEIDTATLHVGLNTRSVEFDLASIWDRLLDSDDGSRYNNAWQTSIYPADKGMEFITRLTAKVPWGSAAVGPGGIGYGSGGTGGGGGGGGIHGVLQ